MRIRNSVLGPGIIFLLLLAFVSEPRAAAHVRYYVWNEGYDTLPKGVFEFEGWTTFKVSDWDQSNKNEVQYQGELEYGVTDHLTIAHYERWKTKNKVGRDDSTVYEGFKFEAKYRFGERGKYGVDPLLYLEWITDPRDHKNPNAIEGKIILSKDFSKLNLTYNQIMKSQLGSGGRTEHNFSIGTNYEIFPGTRVGCELRGNYWRPGSHRNKIALGPTLSYEHQYFWISGGVQFGANRAADDLEARVIFGVPF